MHQQTGTWYPPVQSTPTPQVVVNMGSAGPSINMTDGGVGVNVGVQNVGCTDNSNGIPVVGLQGGGNNVPAMNSSVVNGGVNAKTNGSINAATVVVTAGGGSAVCNNGNNDTVVLVGGGGSTGINCGNGAGSSMNCQLLPNYATPTTVMTGGGAPNKGKVSISFKLKLIILHCIYSM